MTKAIIEFMLWFLIALVIIVIYVGVVYGLVNLVDWFNERMH